MEKKQMEAILFCLTCKDDVPHLITYTNNKLASIECERCHKQTN